MSDPRPLTRAGTSPQPLSQPLSHAIPRRSTPTTPITVAGLGEARPDGSERPAGGDGAPDGVAGMLAAAGIGFHIVYEGPAGRCPAGHRTGRRAA